MTRLFAGVSPLPDDSSLLAFDWAALAGSAGAWDLSAEIAWASVEPSIGPVDPVGTQADRAMLGDVARTTYGVTGMGVKIGILSDSFNASGGYPLDVSSGALPAGISVLKDGSSGGADEGRAMAELIHQVAPGAALAFYTAFAGETDFAAGIEALAAAGCKVIVDDVTYLDEPFFQDGGMVQRAVEDVVAKGVSYFTSASNEGSNFYQAAFNGVTTKLLGLGGNYQAQNFGTVAQPSTLQSLTIARGATVTLDLQWDQPFASIGGGHASGDSLGLVLFNSAGKIVASALGNRTGGDPVQTLRFTNTTTSSNFSLAIVTNGGNFAPNLFKYIAYGQGVTINDPNAGIGSGTVIGHEMLPGVNSVGAIAAAQTPALGGGGGSEAFSSVGPGTILLDAQGNRLPMALSAHKVDFLAPDGVATSVFSPFYGTSAAAPDAAAVAGLMLQANPSLTPTQLTTMLDASAVKVGGPTNGTGAGLIQAPSAVRQALAAGSGLAHAAFVAGPAATAYAHAAGPVPMHAALAALQGDPTAAADFYAQVDTTALDAIWQPQPVGAFAMVQNTSADVSVLPFDQIGMLSA